MNPHDDAVRSLSKWHPPDPTGEGLRRRFLRHLAEHANGMWRDCAPGHITTSVAVLDPAASRVLLAFHRGAGAWRQLGGHCERGDATLGGAALREAAEESGTAGIRLLPPEPVRLDRYLAPCHPAGSMHFDVQYAAVAPAPAGGPLAAEPAAGARWFPVDALPADADDAVRRLVARAVAVHAARGVTG
ncbi:MAG TPA: NUDIX domain-containing protein [Streptosporangiaceae bacterium]